ncbi:MAG: response regulator, partial [Candidatus Altiarchaeales archaeon]|nr:response regulator [Candidatus Altiarchaeales archaeon]
QAEIQKPPQAPAGPLTPLMEQPKGEKPPATGGKPRILVIDDSEVIRNLFRDFLTDKGYEVTLASNGREGLSAFNQAPKGHFSVVICDMEMPQMSGKEVILAIKQADPTQKVILCCSGATLNYSLGPEKVPADAYLDKPVDLDNLLHAVQDLERQTI